MGAKYAPSVAHIFLNKLEDEAIYGEIWPDLRVYRRYIDNILLVWQGTAATLTY